MYASYNDIGGPDGLLSNLKPFKGNSMWARWESDPYYPDRSNYVVYSYKTEIARWEPLPNPKRIALAIQTTGLFPDEWIVSDTKYSVTTTRQQNKCRAWLGYSKRSQV